MSLDANAAERPGGFFTTPSSDFDPEIPLDGWGEHRLLKKKTLKKMYKKRNEKKKTNPLNSSVCLCLSRLIAEIQERCAEKGVIPIEDDDSLMLRGLLRLSKFHEFDKFDSDLRFSTRNFPCRCAFGTQTCEYASFRR